MKRRDALRVMAAAPVLAMCRSGTDPAGGSLVKEGTVLTPDVIKSAEPLGFQWRTLDPFLFCVHHDDAYPKGNASFGPAVPLSGRNIGSDFVVKDGFRMYHGDVVPGFPQ